MASEIGDAGNLLEQLEAESEAEEQGLFTEAYIREIAELFATTDFLGEDVQLGDLSRTRPARPRLG